MTKNQENILVFSITSVLVFVVYFLTSGPGLGLIDCGELTTVTKVLGIAHPTGYPLYTMLGRCWQMPVAFNPARAMVVFSVLFASLAAGVMSLLIQHVLRRIKTVSSNWISLWSILLTLAFAFSRPVWTSISFSEVYPVTLLIGCIILLLSFQFMLSENKEQYSYHPLLVCYLWGLGFGNHFTIMWFFPLIAYIVCKYIQQSHNRYRSLSGCAVLFLLGISVNLYLPIRSSLEPMMDWSDPQTFSSFFRHISAWQYRVWMFKGGFPQLFIKVIAYLKILFSDLGIGLFLFTLVGLATSLYRKSWLLFFVFLVWLCGTLYNLNYDIPDITTYFLLFFAVLFVIAVEGYATLIEALNRHMRNVRVRITAILLISVLVAFSSFALNFREANCSDNHFAENLNREILRTLPDSAFVLQGNWDIQSPAIYLQNIERIRPDVTILDLNLMQRTWYIKQQKRNYPQLFAECSKEIEDFTNKVKPFENSEPYDGQQIEAAFCGLLNKMLATEKRTRPVYLRYAKEAGHPGVGAGFRAYPGSFFFRLADSVSTEQVISLKNIVGTQKEFDQRESYLLKDVAGFIAMQGSFAITKNDTATVRAALNSVNPYIADAPNVIQFVMKAQEYLGMEPVKQ